MVLLFIVLAVFFIGKWIVECVILGLFGVDKHERDIEPLNDYKLPPTVINNYYNENHLHISKDEFEALKK